MSRLFFILLFATCALNSYGQSLRTLSYNSSNNTIVGVTNTTRLLFSNAVQFATAGARDSTFDGLQQGQFPMFVFHVPSGTAWTDFELKGSQTGFIGANPNRLAFYFHSPGTNAFETGGTPLVWFTDSSLDPVRWKRLTNRSSLSASRFNTTTGSIGGIVVVITNTNFSMSRSASTIAWSMLWRSAAATDTNAAGQQIWRPVFPLQFVPASFNPTP